ncbi:MAG: preprotein translocase subunit YajC [Actinomycetota bacterium]
MIQFIASIAAESGGSSPFGLLVPLVLMGGLFYFLLIRPQQRRARAQTDLLSSIDVGDEVITAGGLLGTIVEIDEDDDLITVEIAPGTNVRMVRRAISQKLVEEEEEDFDEDDDDVVALDDAEDEPADDKT